MQPLLWKDEKKCMSNKLVRMSTSKLKYMITKLPIDIMTKFKNKTSCLQIKWKIPDWNIPKYNYIISSKEIRILHSSRFMCFINNFRKSQYKQFVFAKGLPDNFELFIKITLIL